MLSIWIANSSPVSCAEARHFGEIKEVERKCTNCEAPFAVEQNNISEYPPLRAVRGHIQELPRDRFVRLALLLGGSFLLVLLAGLLAFAVWRGLVLFANDAPDGVGVPPVYRAMLFVQRAVEEDAFDALCLEHGLDKWRKPDIAMVESGGHRSAEVNAICDEGAGTCKVRGQGAKMPHEDVCKHSEPRMHNTNSNRVELTRPEGIYASCVVPLQTRGRSQNAHAHYNASAMSDATTRHHFRDIRPEARPHAPMAFVHLVLALARVPALLELPLAIFAVEVRVGKAHSGLAELVVAVPWILIEQGEV